ncbi:OmpA family protein [Mucilaginibacter sp. JRF]|uniref:OmpA family protein n=1 Tax=Mucilaginibacter sp. JRF TaxID=2780088 RepID=UPI001880432C|nr:OmpA family protein [Mucilaginibacter sp. JRF]MBE9586627.1 OmpA family protein [Mucilaginibacter sp. JRF]
MKTKIILSALSLLIVSASYKADGPVSKNAPTASKAAKPAALSVKDMTRNLEFDFCKADIRQPNDNQLDQLAKYLKDGKHAVSLRGHADAIGTYVGNWKMSDKRAIEVKKQLISKGVDSTLIVTTPFGDTLPISSNKTAQGRQKNRRVEIVLKAR